MEISTDTSFLKIYDYNFNSQCIKDVEDKLLVYPKIIIYGRECIQHRSIGFFSNISVGYKYSGKLMKSQKLPNSLEILLNDINNKYNKIFNGILINKYENGCDYISAHSDDEHNLNSEDIMSISYGSNRIFRIRDIKTRKIIKDIITENNKIIHMNGNFQNEFTHEIPIQKKIKDIRYSLTFRTHIK